MDTNPVATLWAAVKPHNLRKLQLPAINDQGQGSIAAGGETLLFFDAPGGKSGLGLKLWQVGWGEYGDMTTTKYAPLAATGKARLIRALEGLRAAEPEAVVETFFLTELLED